MCGPEKSHATDIQPIWDASCKGCHTGGGSSGMLKLDSGYSATVNKPSSQVSKLDLIEPGDPNSSYLWLKLKGTHTAAGGTGVSMPKGGSMSATDLTTIETWITEGANP